VNAAVHDRRALMAELDRLVSEGRNPRSMGIDLMSTHDILSTINGEDHLVPDAVGKVIPEVARAVDAIVSAFGKGGRLIYIGAGTSGRLGVLDASECPPTFGVPYGMVVGLIAGGPSALMRASEGTEDRSAEGAPLSRLWPTNSATPGGAARPRTRTDRCRALVRPVAAAILVTITLSDYLSRTWLGVPGW